MVSLCELCLAHVAICESVKRVDMRQAYFTWEKLFPMNTYNISYNDGIFNVYL